jgi:hypothetical protein
MLSHRWHDTPDESSIMLVVALRSSQFFRSVRPNEYQNSPLNRRLGSELWSHSRGYIEMFSVGGVQGWSIELLR